MRSIAEVIKFLKRNRIENPGQWIQRFPDHFRESRPLFKSVGLGKVYREMLWPRDWNTRSPSLAEMIHSKENLKHMLIALRISSRTEFYEETRSFNKIYERIGGREAFDEVFDGLGILNQRNPRNITRQLPDDVETFMCYLRGLRPYGSGQIKKGKYRPSHDIIDNILANKGEFIEALSVVKKDLREANLDTNYLNKFERIAIMISMDEEQKDALFWKVLNEANDRSRKNLGKASSESHLLDREESYFKFKDLVAFALNAKTKHYAHYYLSAEDIIEFVTNTTIPDATLKMNSKLKALLDNKFLDLDALLLAKKRSNSLENAA